MSPRESRKKELLDYSFKCNCTRCSLPMESTIDKNLCSDINNNIIKDDSSINEIIEEIKKLKSVL